MTTRRQLRRAVAAQDAPALGFVSLADYEAQPLEGTAAVSISGDEGVCVPPGLSTLEDRSYPLAQTAYLYVNAATPSASRSSGSWSSLLTNEAGAATVGPAQG